LLVNLVIGVAVIGATRVPRLGEADLREGFKTARVTSTSHAAFFGCSIGLGLKAQQPALRAAQSLHRELHDGRPRITPPKTTFLEREVIWPCHVPGDLRLCAARVVASAIAAVIDRVEVDLVSALPSRGVSLLPLAVEVAAIACHALARA
jgi:hypothetical protein